MKKKKGFTLIELLAVIIILAIIALIAVPQILKILYKSRLAAAEDSTYGIASSTESYIGNLMLKNDGSYPKVDLEFECDGSCKLTSDLKTKLQNYDLTGLEELKLKGSKPTGGKVIITNGGKTTRVINVIINGFTCNYNNETMPETDGVAVCKKGDETEKPEKPIKPIDPEEPVITTVIVTFSAMGGEVIPTSKEVTYNGSYGELPIPTKENYVFVGWYSLPTYTNQVTSETIVTTKENQILYAKWKGITITVNFDANGGNLTTTSKTVTYDEKYGELPSVTKEGYKFAGWYTENNGGTRITADTIVNISSEQTLYAYWVAENSTVTFNAMGGSVTPPSKEVTYNEAYGELPTPTRANHIFGGWYTLPTYNEVNKVTSATIVSTVDNHTLYAKWIEEVCNNTTKNVSCTKTCANGSKTGTRVDTYDCHNNLVSTGVCNATCSNYTKNNSCSTTCGTGSVSGTRTDTYNGETGALISTGTCNAVCPSGPSGATLTVTPSGTVSNYNTTSVTLTSTVTSGATISKYEFYNGTTLLGTVTTSNKSASTTVSTLVSSNMNFRVVVTDIYGRTSTSSVAESCSLNETTTCYNSSQYQIYKCNTGRQYSTTQSCVTISKSQCPNIASQCSSKCSSACSISGGSPSSCASCLSSCVSMQVMESVNILVIQIQVELIVLKTGN